MKEKKIYKDYLGDKIEEPFKVPDNYFQESRISIEKAIASQSRTYTSLPLQSRYLAIAASLIILALLSWLFILKPKTADTTFPLANDNPNEIEIKQQNNTPQEIINPEKSSPENKVEYASDEMNNHDEPNIKSDNKPIEETPIQLAVEKQNSPKPNSNKIESHQEITPKDNAIDLAYEPSTQYSQQTLNGSQNPSVPGPVVARKSNPNSVRFFQNMRDTCSSSPFRLFACQDEAILKEWDFIWQDGSNAPYFDITSSGDYAVYLLQKNHKNSPKNYVDSVFFHVNMVDPAEIDLGPDQIFCSFENIKLETPSYNPNYNYKWSMGSSKNNVLHIRHLAPGDYTVSLNITGCGINLQDEINIHINECILEFSNVITPNGDGKNDYFVVQGIENYPGSKLYVVDRNGRTIFQSLNYQNNWNGKNVEEGTYFYLLIVNDGKNSEKGGSLTILRK